MPTSSDQKASLSEIEERFENDVERFTNLETGQTATVDAPLAMELITQAAIAVTPTIERVLDIGCGAGNNTIKLLRSHGGQFDCDLNDLSKAMLDRAVQRVSQETKGTVSTIRGDFLSVDLPENQYDVVLAAAVLHHLRTDEDWHAAFSKVYRLLRPGGSFWITDLVIHENEKVHELMWQRYGEYLTGLDGEEYREKVFAYIAREDTPRPVSFQLELMKKVGFQSVDILHKNSCFCAFGAVKGS